MRTAFLLAIGTVSIEETFSLPFDDIHYLQMCHPKIGFMCWILVLCIPLLLSLLSINLVQQLAEPQKYKGPSCAPF